MFLRETQKRRVEQIAQEMGLSCSECGSTALEAYEAEWLLGGTLDAYLECSNCWKENSLELPPKRREIAASILTMASPTCTRLACSAVYAMQARSEMGSASLRFFDTQSQRRPVCLRRGFTQPVSYSGDVSVESCSKVMGSSYVMGVCRGVVLAR